MNRYRVGLIASVVLIAGLLAVYAVNRGTAVNTGGRGSITGASLLRPEDRPTAPDLRGIDAWINTQPLTLQQLRGRVVLIDFWTYSCINCLRTIPDLQRLDATYGPRGLTIIGVHSPEFDFEKVFDNVQRNVKALGVTWPVALDSEMATWNAFQNSVWPANFLIDQQGRLADATQGEGNDARLTADIASLLSAPPPPSRSPEVVVNAQTPELYAGSARGRLADGENYGHPDWQQPDNGGPHDEDAIQLIGSWHDAGEYVESRGDSVIRLRFAAQNVYIVASSADGSVKTLAVMVDGKAVPTNQRGSDLQPSGRVNVSGAALYRVLGAQDRGHHLLDIRVPSGTRLYTFTFG